MERDSNEAIIAAQADRLGILEEALYKILQWAEAYPVEMFPEPDWAKVRDLLAAGGITLDAVSGTLRRHAVEDIGQIARTALNKNILP